MTTDEKHNHFEIGHKGDRNGFRIFAADLAAALSPSKLTTREFSQKSLHYLDALCFNDRFMLPADHIKRLLKTCQKNQVLTFRFADDMKTVTVEIDEGHSRPAVITFKNQRFLTDANFRRFFIWDIDPNVFPTTETAVPAPEPVEIDPQPTPQPDPVETITETPETTPEPQPMPTETPETAVPAIVKPTPRQRRQPAKKRIKLPKLPQEWTYRTPEWFVPITA